MAGSANTVLVLYGSQTGTAADTAECVCRELSRYHVQCRVAAMDDYDIRQLVREHVVCCGVPCFPDAPCQLQSGKKALPLTIYVINEPRGLCVRVY